MTSEPHLDLQTFPSRKAADKALATEIAHRLIQAIDAKGHATMVVSGGSTPVHLFQLLANTQLPWDKVSITLADERLVDPTHADSNTRLVHDHLLTKGLSPATFLPLFSGQDSLTDAIAQCDQLIGQLGKTDLVVLGMGSDGHTASLFPGAESLEEGLDLNSGRHCIAVQPPAAPYLRLSQTLPALLNTDRIFVHFHGREKFAVMEQAQATGDTDKYPIAAILQQHLTPVSVIYAD